MNHKLDLCQGLLGSSQDWPQPTKWVVSATDLMGEEPEGSKNGGVYKEAQRKGFLIPAVWDIRHLHICVRRQSRAGQVSFS